MVEGRTALRSHFQQEGPCGLALSEDAEGVGVNRAHPVAVLEVPGCPAGRVDLGDLPLQESRLHGHGGKEGVDGGGVLDVPEQLAAPRAGHVVPDEWGAGEQWSGAPPLLRDGHGRPVPAGQEGQGPVVRAMRPLPAMGRVTSGTLRGASPAGRPWGPRRPTFRPGPSG